MDNNPTKKTFDFNYLSVILIYIWSLAFLLLTPGIKDAESRIFPYIVSILSIVLATVLLLKTYFNWGKKGEPLNFSGTKSALVMAALLLIYVIAVEFVGFYLATPFYLYISMWILGQRNKKLMLIISLLMPLVIYLFFDVLLDMQIPEGLLLPWLLG